MYDGNWNTNEIGAIVVRFKRPFIKKGGKCWRRTLFREDYTEYAQKKSKYWVVDRFVDDYNRVQDEWIGLQNKQRGYVPCFR